MLNKVTLIGNIGRDAEVRTFNDGGQICSFSLATTERWKSREGERKEKTEWHNVVIKSEHLVKNLSGYLLKGKKIYLEGKIETRKWSDQSGNDKYTTEIIVPSFGGEIKFLSAQSEEQPRGYSDSQGSAPAPSQSQTNGNGIIQDDEIPF